MTWPVPKSAPPVATNSALGKYQMPVLPPASPAKRIWSSIAASCQNVIRISS